MTTRTTNFLAWADRRHFVSVRAIAIYVTLALTWRVTEAAMIFAHSSQFDGTGTAAVIAAFTAPTAALQGFVFKFYMDAK